MSEKLPGIAEGYDQDETLATPAVYSLAIPSSVTTKAPWLSVVNLNVLITHPANCSAVAPPLATCIVKDSPMLVPVIGVNHV